MEDIQEYYDEKKIPMQIIGVINQHYNFMDEDLANLFGENCKKWNNYGGTEEGYKYLEEKIGGKIHYFPSRYIVNKEGQVIGREFFDYFEEGVNKLLEETKKTRNQLTEKELVEIERVTLENFLKLALEDKR